MLRTIRTKEFILCPHANARFVFFYRVGKKLHPHACLIDNYWRPHSGETIYVIHMPHQHVALYTDTDRAIRRCEKKKHMHIKIVVFCYAPIKPKKKTMSAIVGLTVCTMLGSCCHVRQWRDRAIVTKRCQSLPLWNLLKIPVPRMLLSCGCVNRIYS